MMMFMNHKRSANRPVVQSNSVITDSMRQSTYVGNNRDALFRKVAKMGPNH